MGYLMIIHHTPYTLLIISLIEKYNLHHLSHEFCVTNKYTNCVKRKEYDEKEFQKTSVNMEFS